MGLIPGGGMQIEWHTPTRGLEIEILPDGSIGYVKIEGDEYDDGSAQHVKRHKAIEFVRWLMHKS